MSFDIVAYILSKNYVNKCIAALPKGFIYKGAVNTRTNLPNSSDLGAVYTVLYKDDGQTPYGAEFVWGPYSGVNQWIEVGTNYDSEISDLIHKYDTVAAAITAEETRAKNAEAALATTKADDNAVVKLTGNQTINGQKTFSNTVIFNGNVTAQQLSALSGSFSNDLYAKALTVSGYSYLYNDAQLSGNLIVTKDARVKTNFFVEGDQSVSNLFITGGGTVQTVNNQSKAITNKEYVDTNISNAITAHNSDNTAHNSLFATKVDSKVTNTNNESSIQVDANRIIAYSIDKTTQTNGANNGTRLIITEDSISYLKDKTISSVTAEDEIATKGNLLTKADKVSLATAGHFAGLDANGNLTDSGKNASDFSEATNIENSTGLKSVQLKAPIISDEQQSENENNGTSGLVTGYANIINSLDASDTVANITNGIRNTILGGSKNSIVSGQDNISGTFCSGVFGRDNYLTQLLNSLVVGELNTSGPGSNWIAILGHNNTLNGYNTLLTGENNTVDNVNWDLISGENHSIASTYNSLIAGQNHITSGNVNGVLISGSYNNVNTGSTNTTVLGSRHFANMSSHSFIEGENNSLLNSNHSSIIGQDSFIDYSLRSSIEGNLNSIQYADGVHVSGTEIHLRKLEANPTDGTYYYGHSHIEGYHYGSYDSETGISTDAKIFGSHIESNNYNGNINKISNGEVRSSHIEFLGGGAQVNLLNNGTIYQSSLRLEGGVNIQANGIVQSGVTGLVISAGQHIGSITSSRIFGAPIILGGDNHSVSISQSDISGSAVNIKASLYNSFIRGVGITTTDTENALGNITAIGTGLNLNYSDQVVLGTFNDNKENNLFELGNGSDGDHRSNAFEITRDGVARSYSLPVGDNDLTPKSYVDGLFANLNIENGEASGSLNQKGATQASLTEDFSTYGAAYAYLAATNLFEAEKGPDYIKYTLNDFNDNYDNIVKYTATAYVYTGGGSSFPTTGTFEEKYAQIKQILATMIASGSYDEYINATIPQVEAGINQQIATDIAALGLTLVPNEIDKTATLSTALGNNNKIYAPVSFANGYGNIVGDKGWPQATIGAIASGWNMKAWGNGAMAVGERSQFSPGGFSVLSEKQSARTHIKHLQEIYNDEQGVPYWKLTLPASIATASTDADYDAITVEMGEAHQDSAITLGGSSTFTSNSLVAGYSNFNIGQNAAVFNNQNVNTGDNSLVGGLLSLNKGADSLVVGWKNTNLKRQALLAGSSNYMSSVGGITVGYDLINTKDTKAVFGKHNSEKTNTLFELGNGTATNVRSNAFEVTETGIARAYGAPVGDNDLVRKQELDTKSTVSVSDTGTSTTEAKYITVDGTEYKMSGIPTAPTTDGEYVLKATVVSGVPTFTWVSYSATDVTIDN